MVDGLDPTFIAEVIRKMNEVARKYGRLSSDELIDVAEYTYVASIIIKDRITGDWKYFSRAIPITELMEVMRYFNDHIEDFRKCVEYWNHVGSCIDLLLRKYDIGD